MQGRLLYRRDPLAYPSGVAPRVDTTHLAAKGLRFSGVAQGSNFVNLTQGTKGTIAGTTTSFAMDGSIGPTFQTTSGADATKFSGQVTGDVVGTSAALCRFNAIASGQCLFANSATTNAGLRFNITAGGTLGVTSGGVIAQDSLLPVVAGVPYFLIVSMGASAANYLVLRLDTGKVITATSSGGGLAAADGTFMVGNDVFNEFANAKIAAAMFAGSFLSRWEMMQWAADPWAFWYPRQLESLIKATAAGGSFLAAWARGSNLPVIGTGLN